MPQVEGICPGATTEDGRYAAVRADDWVSGFWAGMLWLAYDRTGLERYREAAWPYDQRMESYMIQDHNFIHDVGFQFLNTAVMKHMITGDEEGKRRGLSAANFLAGRYNPAGQFIRAWKWNADTGWAIIDCTMNLSLLFWASEASGDPRFKHIARLHADTVLEHFIRADGSVRHIVSFDPESGAFIEALGGQGYGPNSSWSRGQAWALYGLANTFRFTKDVRFLDAAKRVAHYFVSNVPADGIPYWDFRLPTQGRENEPRDSAAGAIAASGLLEIAELVREEERDLYLGWADRLLVALTDRCGTFGNNDMQAILTHGTGNKPNNHQIEVGLIYGDYFYMEAVAKRTGWTRKVY